MYEITEYNSVIYYCEDCRQEAIFSGLGKHATALCMVRECTFCGEKKLVNVYKDKAVFIPLSDNGVPSYVYVEREGV